jgi:hypothetical protein
VILFSSRFLCEQERAKRSQIRFHGHSFRSPPMDFLLVSRPSSSVLCFSLRQRRAFFSVLLRSEPVRALDFATAGLRFWALARCGSGQGRLFSRRFLGRVHFPAQLSLRAREWIPYIDLSVRFFSPIRQSAPARVCCLNLEFAALIFPDSIFQPPGLPLCWIHGQGVGFVSSVQQQVPACLIFSARLAVSRRPVLWFW